MRKAVVVLSFLFVSGSSLAQSKTAADLLAELTEKTAELTKAHAAEDELLKFDKLLKKTLSTSQNEVVALKTKIVHEEKATEQDVQLRAELKSKEDDLKKVAAQNAKLKAEVEKMKQEDEQLRAAVKTKEDDLKKKAEKEKADATKIKALVDASEHEAKILQEFTQKVKDVTHKEIANKAEQIENKAKAEIAKIQEQTHKQVVDMSKKQKEETEKKEKEEIAKIKEETDKQVADLSKKVNHLESELKNKNQIMKSIGGELAKQVANVKNVVHTTQSQQVESIVHSKAVFSAGYKKSMDHLKAEVAKAKAENKPALAKVEKKIQELHASQKQFKEDFKKAMAHVGEKGVVKTFEQAFTKDLKKVVTKKELDKDVKTAFEPAAEKLFDKDFKQEFPKIIHAEEGKAEFDEDFENDFKSIVREADNQENHNNALAVPGFKGDAAAISAYNKRAAAVGAGALGGDHKGGASNISFTFVVSIVLPLLCFFY